MVVGVLLLGRHVTREALRFHESLSGPLFPDSHEITAQDLTSQD